MSITTRLSWFFLAALGTVLVSFSLLIYSLARGHLHAAIDQQLEAANRVLVAAIEVHPSDVEWEPIERKIPLGDLADTNHVRWAIRDEMGRLVDRSGNLSAAPLVADDGQWLVHSSRVRAGQFEPAVIDRDIGGLVAAIEDSTPADPFAQRQAFDLTVALSTRPMRDLLANLATALAILSIVVWLVAAGLSRWLCRRALSPVRQMAAVARTLQQSPDSMVLLPVAANNDELTDLGQAFNDLLMMLRDTLTRQRRFSSDASHQLRTPLTAMLTAVDVALRHDRQTEMYRQVLEIVQRRGRELTAIVETLQLLARGEPDAALGFSTFDLNEFCSRRIDSWRDHLRAGDLLLQLAPQEVLVTSHPLLVGEVIDNLIDNAFKYSDSGTAVSIQVTVDDNSAIVSVVDRGIGIAPGELAQVFEPFFRGAEARWRCRTGAGLGLSIARRLATLAGGVLAVESDASHGTTFRFALDRTRSAGLSRETTSELSAATQT